MVSRHLHDCWHCRLRLSEIESQVLRATRALQQDAFPGPERIVQARLKFERQADTIAAEFLRPRHAVRSRGWMFAAASAAASVVLAGAFLAWRANQNTARPDAAVAVQQLVAAEVRTARVTTHQRFRVVTRQLRPVAISHEGQLDLWSQPERERFMSRLSDGSGVLRQALWQPEPGRQYVYSGRTSTIARVSRREARELWKTLLSQDALTLEEFESELLTWLENREWRPVSFSSGVAMLANENGNALKVEQIRSTPGQDMLRMRARASSGRVSIEFVLDVEKQTYAPRLQSIRYESPARVLELQLRSEPAAGVVPASFEPPASLTEAHDAPVRQPVVQAAPQTPPDPAASEIEVHSALHRVRACQGETIEVVRARDGTLRVQGTVVSPDRKAQVLAAMATVGVTADLKSADELLAEIDPERVRVHDSPAARTHDPRIGAKVLSRYFGGKEADAEAFIDRALSAGEAVVTDAQALRTLAETFGAAAESLSPNARTLLKTMVTDHLDALDRRLRAASSTLRPVLGEENTESATSSSQRWDAELLRIHQLSKALTDHLRALPGIRTSSDEQRVLRDIGQTMSDLEAAIASARARAADYF
jgi:hypothetical protein